MYLPLTLKEEGVAAVDHHLGDSCVLEQGLYGTEPANLVDHLTQKRFAIFLGGLAALLGIENGLQNHPEL